MSGMGRVLALALDDSLRRAIAAVAGPLDVSLEEVEPAALQSFLETVNERQAPELAVLGPTLEEPIRTAQRIFVAAARLPVLILSEQARHADLCRALEFAPYLTEHLRCVDGDDPHTVAEAARDLIERGRKRREHRDTIDALNARISATTTIASPPALLGGLLDSAPIGVVVVDAQARIRAWNRMAGEVLGRSERAALGRRFDELLSEEERPRWEGQIRSVLEGVVEAPREVFQTGGEGATRHVEITARRMAPQDRSLLLILQDVTDRVRLVADLQEALRVRDEFLSIASHELRTPLASMQLRVDQLVRIATQVEPEKVRARAESVAKGVEKLTRLLDDLLDVSRIQQHRLELHPEPVDLREVVREVADRYRPECERARCTLSIEGEGPPMEGRWDRLRLDQVVSNLLSNAIKYGAGQPISIHLRDDGAQVTMTVRDRGIGIPPDLQARVFERFERAVSSKNYGGLGLGLWITRQIVEAHRGCITLWSEPGSGSEFTVQLPRKLSELPT